MRGEHIPSQAVAFPKPGSSPHARGTLRCVAADDLVARFIPACAGNTSDGHDPKSASPVHPRMRGEHPLSWISCTRPTGSSPHARGTPPRQARRPTRDRFIPACAGNTYPLLTSQSTQPVHPRMRGEHARGENRLTALVRFIPACAGNTAMADSSGVSFTVHPRMRGEHAGAAADQVAVDGSSPHARGTREFVIIQTQVRRFIPACAGNTIEALRVRVIRSVHPRMRGEHSWGVANIGQTSGSSPHARGTQYRDRLAPRGGRFIPACAGNT